MIAAVAIALPGAALAAAKARPARYSVKTIGDIVQLRDNQTDSTVSVLTGTSNAYEFVVHGKNVLSMAIPSTTALRNNPGLNGVPFLGPFANRLDEMAFYANGKKYNFDPELGNVRAPIPQQGFLSNTHDWKLVTARADANGAYVVSKLEFYRNPDWMKQFPFAQTYTMTIRLKDGVLEVNTRIDNLSKDPLPVSIGYHPYFALPEGDRNHWSLDFGARTHWIETDAHLPTGETQTAEQFFGGDRHNVPLSRLADKRLDEVFSDLDRDAQGRASVVIKGEKSSITVTAGPKIKTFLLYSEILPPPGTPPRPAGPPRAPAPNYPYDGPVVPLTAPNDVPRSTRGFIAIEPMAGITNSMNMAHKGSYKELQYVAPGGSWNESIWITPRGF
ncbi:aldose 1-epimerase [Sphingomonas quercus]|uniref:Aldose 1-epimerase n=1 Tax=Sphingomonas quercus TaxID=2842451 RepID=A0ABS6BHL5_9SPHN|nr:aldose 1-epimerase [Sphingomonas quercus]MBU3076720.1 aldose 1-epimerase [Sphingomonas quercus]